MKNNKLSTPIFKALDILGNVFVLNMIYVIFCLPVITIGASTTALYSVSIKMVRQKEDLIIRDFVQAFKSNFKQSTVTWAIIIAINFLLWGSYIYINNFIGFMATFYIFVFVIEAVVLILILPFLFPLIACFENTIYNTLKNALLLSISNLGSCLKIILAWFAPIAISMIYPVIFLNTWYLWLLVVFGFIGYGTSFTINKVFNKIADAQTQNALQETAKKS